MSLGSSGFDQFDAHGARIGFLRLVLNPPFAARRPAANPPRSRATGPRSRRMPALPPGSQPLGVDCQTRNSPSSFGPEWSNAERQRHGGGANCLSLIQLPAHGVRTRSMASRCRIDTSAWPIGRRHRPHPHAAARTPQVLDVDFVVRTTTARTAQTTIQAASTCHKKDAAANQHNAINPRSSPPRDGPRNNPSSPVDKSSCSRPTQTTSTGQFPAQRRPHCRHHQQVADGSS